MSRAIAAGLAGLLVAAALALPIAPCTTESPRLLQLGRVVAYGLGSLVCHQRVERSLHACGRPWPVCGRCAGLYLGGAAGVLLALGGLARTRAAREWRRRIVAAAAPTAVLWTIEVVGLWNPGTPLRAVAAGLLGVAGGAWLTAVARGDL